MNLAARLRKTSPEKVASSSVSSAFLVTVLSIGSNLIAPAAGRAQHLDSQASPRESIMQTLMDWQTCFARGFEHDRTAALAACDRVSASQESLPPDLLQKARVRLERRRQMILEGKAPAPNADTTALSKK